MKIISLEIDSNAIECECEYEYECSDKRKKREKDKFMTIALDECDVCDENLEITR